MRRDVTAELKELRLHGMVSAWTDLTADRTAAMDSSKWLIEQYAYENETVLVAPAQGFYATPGKGVNEVRLAFMLKSEEWH